ncbi:hypothetical protein QTP88_009424 [Uroleucon formosanum]
MSIRYALTLTDFHRFIYFVRVWTTSTDELVPPHSTLLHIKRRPYSVVRDLHHSCCTVEFVYLTPINKTRISSTLKNPSYHHPLTPARRGSVATPSPTVVSGPALRSLEARLAYFPTNGFLFNAISARFSSTSFVDFKRFATHSGQNVMTI